jgi:hypothetical protein
MKSKRNIRFYLFLLLLLSVLTVSFVSSLSCFSFLLSLSLPLPLLFLQVLQMLGMENEELTNEINKQQQQDQKAAPIKITAATVTKKPKSMKLNANTMDDEEEGGQKRRELIPLDYSEEELRQGENREEEREEGEEIQQPVVTVPQSIPVHQPSVSASSSSSSAVKPKLDNETLKKLAEKVPADK